MAKLTQIVDGWYGDVAMPVLGDQKLAEKLVEWSKGMRAGQEAIRTTSWGLTLAASANDGLAVRYIIDERKLNKFLGEFFLKLTVLHFTDWGISVTSVKEETAISVYTGKEKFERMHIVQKNGVRKVALCVIHITEEGFFLESPAEKKPMEKAV